MTMEHISMFLIFFSVCIAGYAVGWISARKRCLDEKDVPCVLCGGRGWVFCPGCDGDKKLHSCACCHGKGIIVCPQCKGKHKDGGL